MKKLLILTIILSAFSCSDEPEVKTTIPKGAVRYSPVDPSLNNEGGAGCGKDINGVKYCCNAFGVCWRVD